MLDTVILLGFKALSHCWNPLPSPRIATSWNRKRINRYQNDNTKFPGFRTRCRHAWRRMFVADKISPSSLVGNHLSEIGIPQTQIRPKSVATPQRSCCWFLSCRFMGCSKVESSSLALTALVLKALYNTCQRRRAANTCNLFQTYYSNNE